MKFQWNHHFLKLYKSPKSLFFVGEWYHHFCWPKGMKSLCVCVLAKSHESQLLKDITDTGFYHKIPWIFHEISIFADWSSRMLSCCVSSCTFDDTCHHGRKCYGDGPEQKWLYEPRKMKCLPILTLKNGLDFTRDNLGNSDSKMGHPQKYRPSNSKSWEFTSKNALEMKQCVLFCMFFYCKNQHFCLPI